MHGTSFKLVHYGDLHHINFNLLLDDNLPILDPKVVPNSHPYELVHEHSPYSEFEFGVEVYNSYPSSDAFCNPLGDII